MIEKPRGRFLGRPCGALAAVAALTAVAGGLAACGGSSASSTTTATAAANSAAAIGPNPAAKTTTSAASKPAGVASPGTKLSIGQSARVAYTPLSGGATRGPSTLLVTVKSFEKGSLADFNGIKLNAAQKASTPVYVKVHVTNLGPHNIDVDGSAAAIEGVDSTGEGLQSVTFIGDFPRCPDTESTRPLGAGRGYDSCLTFLVPGGVTKISYNGTSDYIDSPVTWAPN
jgi:hypothetical protein